MQSIAPAMQEEPLNLLADCISRDQLARELGLTRKAFTNEALLHKLEQELAEERPRVEKRRDDDRQVDHDRLARIERDIHDMRNLIFAAFQRRDGD